MDWTRWIFREEKLHSAVLAELLVGDRGDDVAAALLRVGLPEGAPLSAVEVDLDWPGYSRAGASGGVELESPVSRRPGRTGRRSADLSCGLRVDGEPRRLIIEVKVDSAGDRSQLDDMAWANDHVIFLALGTSAFDRSQADLDKDAELRFTTFETSHLSREVTEAQYAREINGRAWCVVDPVDWLGVLEAGDVGAEPWFRAYVERMRIEADIHREATAAVHASRAPSLPAHMMSTSGPNGPDARLERLVPSAWALALRRTLWATEPHGRLNMTAERDGRVTRCLIWPHGWSAAGDARGDLYLQFDAEFQPGGPVAVRGAVRASGHWQDDERLQFVLASEALLDSPLRGRSGDSIVLANAAVSIDAVEDAAAWATTVIAAIDSELEEVGSPPRC